MEARERCDATRQEAELWTELHDDERTLAAAWPRWDSLFQQAASAKQEATKALGRLQESDDEWQGYRNQLEEAEGERTTADEELKKIALLLEDAEKNVAAFDLAAIAAERKAAQARQSALALAKTRWMAFSTLRDGASRLREASAAQATAIEETRIGLERIEHERGPAIVARDEAQRFYEEARQACAKSVEKLRASLEPGRPCPVCGSPEHPYAAAEVALDEAVAALKRQLGERQRAVDELTREAARLEAAAGAAVSRQREIEDELESADGGSAHALETWERDPLAEETSAISETNRQAWFDEQLDAIDHVLLGVETRENSARFAMDAREETRKHHAAARKALDSAARAEEVARSKALSADSTRAGRQEALALADGQLEALLQQLDLAFGSGQAWRSAWHEDPPGFHLAQEHAAQLWQEHRDVIASSIATLASLDAALVEHTKAVKRSGEEQRIASEAMRVADEQLAAARHERATLLNGRSAADVRRELEDAVDTSRRQAKEGEDALADAVAGKGAADARFANSQATLKLRLEGGDRVAAALAAWVVDHNVCHPELLPLDIDTLRLLLEFDASWLRAEREALQQLDSTVAVARSLYQERRGRREDVESERSTDESMDVLSERHGETSTALDSARSDCGELRSRLREDDERRDRARGLAADIERQQSIATLWAEMNELIGSADGKKFRNYAQQLTLDVLLAYANQHLGDLSRRYTVKRLQDRLALAVIDRDMGDEVRSVYSLSGGESFLVSLALALGLASLSANRVRVESLFIDEGFGSLDADTLSIAMDALDRLHSQGRKVGVISHVQEMAERIGTRVSVERQSGGRSLLVVA